MIEQNSIRFKHMCTNLIFYYRRNKKLAERIETQLFQRGADFLDL